MLKLGFAVMYRGRDAIYDKEKSIYTEIENKAKNGKKGLWKIKNFQLPREYKQNL